MDLAKCSSADMPDSEMTGLDDAPVVVERVVYGADILKELRAQTAMPYHDGSSGPSMVASAAARVRTALDSDLREYNRVRKDPEYRPVMAFSRVQAERLGLMSPDRTSHLDRLLEAAPTAARHEAALQAGQAMSVPVLADPGEKHDLPPFVAQRTFEISADSSTPLRELPAPMPDLTTQRLQEFAEIANKIEKPDVNKNS